MDLESNAVDFHFRLPGGRQQKPRLLGTVWLVGHDARIPSQKRMVGDNHHTVTEDVFLQWFHLGYLCPLRIGQFLYLFAFHMPNVLFLVSKCKNNKKSDTIGQVWRIYVCFLNIFCVHIEYKIFEKEWIICGIFTKRNRRYDE